MQIDNSKSKVLIYTMNRNSQFSRTVILLLLTFSLFTIHYSLFTREALAHCPLCVAGAGVGLSLSRVLGIDDSITGVWMATFLGATGFWISNSIKKTYIPLQKLIIYTLIFVTTILSFYRFGLINEHNGLIFNLPKLTFGMITGGVLLYLVDAANTAIKGKNSKVLFPYQSIVLMLGSMVVLSIGIYILINYFI